MPIQRQHQHENNFNPPISHFYHIRSHPGNPGLRSPPHHHSFSHSSTSAAPRLCASLTRLQPDHKGNGGTASLSPTAPAAPITPLRKERKLVSAEISIPENRVAVTEEHALSTLEMMAIRIDYTLQRLFTCPQPGLRLGINQSRRNPQPGLLAARHPTASWV